jgi:hydrogenase maturation protease
MKTIIVGIGNPILGDDGVGVHIADQLKKQINDPDITIDHAYTGGMNLLDIILGYDKAILIDTIKTPSLKQGTVQQYDLSELPTRHSHNPHDVSFSEAISLAQQLGEQRIPKEIKIIGISLHKTPLVFQDCLSPPIESAIPKAVELTLSILHPNETKSQGEKNL